MKYIKYFESDDWEIDNEEPDYFNFEVCQSFDELEIGDKVEYVYNETVGCEKFECNNDGKRKFLDGDVGTIHRKYQHSSCKYVFIDGTTVDFEKHGRWWIAYPQLLRKI